MSEEREEFYRKQNAYIDGYDAGIEQKQREMVIEMYNKKISIKDISDITKLPIENIQKIIDDSNSKED